MDQFSRKSSPKSRKTRNLYLSVRRGNLPCVCFAGSVNELNAHSGFTVGANKKFVFVNSGHLSRRVCWTGRSKHAGSSMENKSVLEALHGPCVRATLEFRRHNFVQWKIRNSRKITNKPASIMLISIIWLRFLLDRTTRLFNQVHRVLVST